MTETNLYKSTPCFHAPDEAAWRGWLEQNHRTQPAVWLIIFKKESGTASVYYPEAVDQALCFGWIDSVANKRDADSFYQYFAQRKPKSNWSRVNKAKVERLLAAGKMTPAGLELVELAKSTGTWTALDDVENCVVPPDLQAALALQPQAWAYWQAFPRSAQRAILEWLFNARTPTTRARRIETIVAGAANNKRVLFKS